MKIKELIEKYTFHDSTINRIKVDKEQNKICFDIDFCNYMQTDYNNEEEILKVKLVFKNISTWESDGLDIENFNWDEELAAGILNFELINNGKVGVAIHMELTNYDTESELYIKMIIICEEVDFIMNKPKPKE